MRMAIARGVGAAALTGVVLLVTAVPAIAHPVLHWQGRTEPLRGEISPLAVLASPVLSGEEPVNPAVRRLKRLEAEGRHFGFARVRAIPELIPGEARAAGSPTVSAGAGAPGFDSLNSFGGYPPDVDVAAGAGSVAETVNTGLSVWTRTGNLRDRISLGSLFNAPVGELTDPQIAFDPQSNRWFLSDLRSNASAVYIAVSVGPDPTGAWRVWYFTYGSGYCPDQPRLGVSSDVVAISVALFNDPACHSEQATQAGGLVLAVNKAEMVTGASSPSFQSFGPDVRYENYQPASEPQPSSEQLFAAAQLPSSSVIHVLHLSGSPPAATFTATNTYLVSALYTPPPATQRGSPLSVDTGDNRISSAVLLNGVLYVSANDACSDASGAITACVRIMEINVGLDELLGETDLGGTRQDWYYGAVAPDSSGNLLAVFDYSSPTDYPSIGAIGVAGPLSGENGRY